MDWEMGVHNTTAVRKWKIAWFIMEAKMKTPSCKRDRDAFEADFSTYPFFRD